MNFGAFAGGLSQGMERGMRIGKSLREIEKENRIAELHDKGMAEVEADRARTAANMIKESGVTATNAPAQAAEAPAQMAADGLPTVSDAVAKPVSEIASPTASPDAAGAATAASSMPSTPAPAAAPVVQATPDAAATPQQAVASTGLTGPNQPKFTVNGKGYATHDEALKAANESLPSANEMFLKKSGEFVQNEYLRQGRPDMAEAYGKYAESVTGKRKLKELADAFTAPDLDTAVQKFGAFYNRNVDDGVNFTGHKMVIKPDGTQVAVATLKSKDGKETHMELTKDTLLNYANAVNPQKLFEQENAKQTAAAKMKAEYALKAQQRKIDMADKKELEDHKSKNRMEEIGLKEELKSEFDNKFQKAKSDEERSHITRQYLADKNQKWSKMSEDEKADAIATEMRSSLKAAGKIKAEKDGKVEVQDKPVPYDSKQKVVYNKITGRPYHLIDGKYVPIDGEVPSNPAAAGMPKR